MKLSFFLFTFILLIMCSSTEESSRSDIYISIHDLIEQPELYDKKPIETKGLLSYGFEDGSIYANRKAYRKKKLNKAIWLEFESQDSLEEVKLDKWLSENNGKEIHIKGVFSNKKSGHNSKYEFSIRKTAITNSISD